MAELSDHSVRLSLALHEAAIPHMHQDWDRAAAQMRSNIAKMRGLVRGSYANGWLDEWESAIDAGPHAVEKLALASGERSNDLRQMTPFAGVLPFAEQRMIVQKVKRAA